MGLASVAPCCDTELIRESFATIPQVQSIHVLFRESTCRITIAVPTKNYALEDRIYDAQYALMDRAPGLRIDLNIVVLGSRKLEDIVTSVGEKVFPRAA
jgi:hypothetical protein